jgi:hypothetical integral membrane protein (TIGR02206 family)
MDLFQYFAKDYTGGPFVLFGTGHLIALVVVALFNIWVVRQFRGAPEATLKKVRWGITAALWLNELAWHLWNVYCGTWTIQTMLPFHLCSVLVWGGGLALLTRNKAVYEFMYFLGIGGALQALLTPEAGIYGLPHFRAFQTLIAHGLILSSPIYMTFIEGFRPTWKSILRVAVIINIYMVIVFFVNKLLDSNYLFIARKPETASILDMLPDWPVYILYMEALGIVTCLILYIPFAIKDWRASRVAAA